MGVSLSRMLLIMFKLSSVASSLRLIYSISLFWVGALVSSNLMVRRQVTWIGSLYWKVGGSCGGLHLNGLYLKMRQIIVLLFSFTTISCEIKPFCFNNISSLILCSMSWCVDFRLVFNSLARKFLF